MTPKAKPPAFEQSLAKLEEIVRKLEEEETPLEPSLKLFEEGQALVRTCEKQLRDAENRIRELMEQADGSVGDAPFAPEDDAESPPPPAQAGSTEEVDADLPF